MPVDCDNRGWDLVLCGTCVRRVPCRPSCATLATVIGSQSLRYY